MARPWNRKCVQVLHTAMILIKAWPIAALGECRDFLMWLFLGLTICA